MIERVIENWLTKINERSLEVPFCQLLAGESYQVIHLTRHGPSEEGKDVLAISPDGVPCAFQLKGAGGGKITQKVWKEYYPQIIRLVELPIIHPSIDKNAHRRVYFVTNGELDEEVRIEIEHRNIEWERRGYPRLETIVKGQLFERFKRLHTDWWPIQLDFEKNLLEFFLADGSGLLSKDKLSQFVIELLPLSGHAPAKSETARALASAAVLITYALSPYVEKQNHVALVEGWMIYLASLISVVEKHDLDENYWKDSFAISVFAVEQALTNLCEELKIRDYLVEGNPLVDAPFYRGRMTWLVSLVATFALWQRLTGIEGEVDSWSQEFVREHMSELWLWGEAAIPQFLAILWFLEHVTATLESDAFLNQLISSVSESNGSQKFHALPDPYHALSEIVMQAADISQSPLQENYVGRSYTLEALIELYTRRGWRGQLALLWPQITRVDFAEFTLPSAWEYCLWESEHGSLCVRRPNAPQRWSKLQTQSRKVDLSLIPKLFQQHPELLLLFVIVYPHRLTKEVAKFLDDRLRESRKRA